MTLSKRRTQFGIVSALTMSVFVSVSGAAPVSLKDCVNLLHDARSLPKTLPEAWKESASALKQIDQSVYGRRDVIESLATAVLAKEFVWFNGEPGGAKTFLSRLMFGSVLNSIPETEKKIFVLQFHKLISEGKISGFQKFSSMMKEGKYEIETASSLVGERFLFLIADEAEKANPAVLNALLSVLNERKAFLGSRVVDAALSSGVFTSNKTTGEFIQGFLADRASGEALLDRMAIKIHIPNQQLSHQETLAMYDLVKNPGKSKITLPLHDLQALVRKVQISDDMMAEIVGIAREFDRYVVQKADQSRAAVRFGEAETEYFPANQFSNRSVRRMIEVFKSALIARQLMEGVPFEKMRLKPVRSDLSLLTKSALYTGPAGLRLKTFALTEAKKGAEGILEGAVKVESRYGSEVELSAHYSPYEGKLYLRDQEGKTGFSFSRIQSDGKSGWQLDSQSADFSDWSVDKESLQALKSRIEKLNQEAKIDPKKPRFELDGGIDKLLSKGTIKERTRQELESIKKDLEQFGSILDRRFETDAPSGGSFFEKWLPGRSLREMRAFRRETLALPVEKRVSKYYDWTAYEVKALKQRFVELDHSIEAHLTGMLSDQHLYVFGPPGGAKTALAEVILKSELKHLNHREVDQFVEKALGSIGKDEKFLKATLARMKTERPKEFDRFLLQFHKLLPEGVLVGFPKVEKQLEHGIEEIETATSLASSRFLFAILDEVDKANPQTVTALLSLLNEREVFAGSQVIKTNLRSAILTSNKMPSEFLDSYLIDRSTGEAVMDRAANKVYVSNKISSEESLTKFLVGLEKGISPSWKGLTAVSELKPLVNQVEFATPSLREMLAQIHETFLELRIKKEEETFKAHKMDPREFPDYYVAAAGSASDRTFIRLMDQLKARFIVHQMMEGVPYQNIRTTIELKDLGLFFEGLGYWAPQKIVATEALDGVIQFANDSRTIEKLLASGVADSRVKFHLEMMLEESKDFTRVLNSVTGDFMATYKKEIAKYPNLFPGGLKGEGREEVGSMIRDLAGLRLNLDLAKGKGAASPELTALGADYIKKEKKLLAHLEDNRLMTRDEFESKMRSEIDDLQGKRRKKEQVEARVNASEIKVREEQIRKIKESVVDGNRVVFHPIAPGKFKMGEVGKQINVEITKPFDMSATPTTQIVWREIAEKAEKRFPGKFGLNADPSSFKGGLRPVEQVSYEDVQNWITALNDLSKSGEKSLDELIPGHKAGDIYRLPTEAEWEYVVRGRGQYNDTYHFGNQESQLGDYAWFSGNSGDQTHEVAQKKPLIVDGKEFYDMHGNVWEWTHDWYGSNLPGGKDPQGPASGSFRLLRGGSWNYDAGFLRSAFRNSSGPGYRFQYVGFRLVRTAR